MSKISMKHKILNIIICFCMLSTYFSGLTNIFAIEKTSNWDSALHFTISHWHSVLIDDEEAEKTGINTRYEPVTFEGYIVPNNDKYDIYLSDEDDDDFKIITSSSDIPKYKDYIGVVDNANGTIEFKINPKVESGHQIENFSGLSISAGHKAITTNNDTSIIISYKNDIHLTKANIFYLHNNVLVPGSHDEQVFGSNAPTGSDERDTAYVYTFITEKEYNDDQYNVGDILKDENGNPIFATKPLPDGLTESVDVKKTKVYSTLAGLHTDKTVTPTNDNRTFKVDLESWMSGQNNADVAFVLDASASMSFTANTPTAININDLNLSKEEKDKLLEKTPKKKASSDNEIDWSEVFLTPEEENLIFDTGNTDNDPLGVNGYTYYVFDGREQTNEYVPIGYWDGSKRYIGVPKSESLIGYYAFNKGDYKDNHRDWLKNNITSEYGFEVKKVDVSGDYTFIPDKADDGWSRDDLKMSAGDGFVLTQSKSGIMLDAKPKSGNFTVSFKISIKSYSQIENIKEIMYIGPLSSGSNYLRTYRNNLSSSARLKGEDKNKSAVSNLNNIFNVNSSKGGSIIITYVYENGKLASYVNGELNDEEANKDKTLNLDDINIIFNGITDDCNDTNDISIDDIFVFDAALDSTEVSKLINVDGSKLRLAAASRDENGKIRTTGTFQDITGDEELPYTPVPGWYYINHSTTAKDIADPDIQTAKEFDVNSQTDIYKDDEIDLPEDHDEKLTKNGSGYEYNPNEDGYSPNLRFYINDEGYVLCFYKYGTSYVYEKEDSDYTKVEVLQHAFTSFASTLSEQSPGSRISAVRFSTKHFEEETLGLDKLVLLDWTSNPIESGGILSLNRGNGEGKSLDNTPSSSNLNQYNYYLTGGTYTRTGLQTFKEQLLPTDKDTNNKYLVIFTDGKDNEYDSSKSIEDDKTYQLAKELKEKHGYTIFTIILPGGPIKEGTKDYADAKNFLVSLSGNKDSDEAEKEKYFLTTESLNTSGKKVDVAEELADLFTTTLLSQIADNLYNYTVTDYLDPRFDLVDANNKVWHLNANGKVVVENGPTYYLTNNKPQNIILSNDYDISDKAKSANLFYDEKEKMYYLSWEHQTIPGCGLESDQLTVWNGRFTIKAKDDFIGGNAILTNGNDKKMNYVHHPVDAEPSSGTNKMIRVTEEDLENGSTGQINLYPSKGFPRVTVNVGYPEEDVELKQVIYLGEPISGNKLFKALLDTAKAKETSDSIEKYYWEYIERYIRISDQYEYIEDFIDALLKSDVEVPYSYISNGKTTSNNSILDLYSEITSLLEDANQTGSELHEKDIVGKLTYSWEIEDEYKEDNEYITKNTDTIISKLSVKYTPIPIDEREDKVKELIKEKNNDTNEKIYLWDRDYKDAAGDIITDYKLLDGRFDTNIVSGKIVLQMVLDSTDLEILGNKTLTYSANLIRIRDNKEEKVGVFKINYTNQNNNTSEVVTAQIEYEDDYKYAETYGLPIGDYKIVAIENYESIPALLKFGEIKNIKITNEHYDLFDNNAIELSAPVSSEIAKLGTESKSNDIYTNSRYALYQLEVEQTPTGSISIEKEVIGENADKDLEFEFTIEINSGNDRKLEPESFKIKDNSNNNVEINWTVTTNGYEGKVKIKHGQVVTIDKIPSGTTYTIEETEKYDYDLKATYLDGDSFSNKNQSTTIVTDTTQKWKFVNHAPVTLPNSGGIGTIIFYILGGLLISSSILYILIKRKKLSN